MKLPIKFRFPIEQTSQNSVTCTVPTGGEGLVHINTNTAKALDLSEKEYDKCQALAEEAAIRSILIVE